MNTTTISLIAVGICVIIVFIGVFFKKSEFIINFVLRTIFGCISMYLINEFLIWQQLDLTVGLNPLTAVTTGVLGLPGIILLYGINLYKFL